MSVPTPPTATITQEALAGLVERVTYHNAENGFCVLRLRARGHRDLVTLVGHAAVVSAGEWINATGGWVNDRTHGQQFRAKFLKTAAPTSIDGIERYLASGMIRGIGPVYAKKLVRAFGEKVFDVIEAEPDRLREVGGIRSYPSAPRFPQLTTIAMVESRIERGDKIETEQRSYISSRALSAAAFAEAARGHWSIENNLHWTLDVTFNEDQSRLRAGHGAKNMAVVRHFALNLVRQAADNRSIKRRRKRAAWDPKYLLEILGPLRC